ncbi:6613_t:CDS:10 [Dentiscutata heterogama]|uniref:6613_t:CDS:1 n=1 Tax=Dentiscutata heterogama TaxID=1316150 RepID=A0ACA9K646_9GLOM|nr:6613_t:CDS:10 [Dentiscutata heterogama]
MLLNSWKEQVHLKRVALSSLLILCFLIIISDAKTTTKSYSENGQLTVAQVDTYSDDTIIILLKSSTGSCSDNTLHFRIISKDGTETPCDYYNSSIPQNNFCFPASSNIQKRNYQENEEDCDENESKPVEHPIHKYPEHSDDKPEDCTTTGHYESKPTEHPKNPDESEDCTTTYDYHESKPTEQPGKKDCKDSEADCEKNCEKDCENSCKQPGEDCANGCKDSDVNCKNLCNLYEDCKNNCQTSVDNCKKSCSNDFENCGGTSSGGNGGNGSGTGNGGNGSGTGSGNGGNGSGTGSGNGGNGSGTGTSGGNGSGTGSGTSGGNGGNGSGTGTTPNGGTPSTTPVPSGSSTIPISSNGTGIVIPPSKTSGSYGLYGDSIVIYALTKPLVLVTYYCNYPSQSYQRCGIIVDWSTKSARGDVITFDKSCTASQIIKSYKYDGFMYTCYDYTTNTLTWTPYILNTDGSITKRSSGQTSEIAQISNMTQFSKYIKIFPIENDDYGLVYTKIVPQSGLGITSSTTKWSLYAMWISSQDSSMTGDVSIYDSQPGTNTTDYNLYQCSVAHDSIGYNCLVYTKRTDKTVYVNINFWKNGNVNKTDEINLNLPAPYTTYNVIDVEPLSHGGYIFIAENSTNTGQASNVKGFIYYENGTSYGPWDIPDFTSNSGAFGSVVSLSPAPNTVVSPPVSALGLTYAVPVSKSTGFFKIWEVNTTGGDDILRGQIPASDDRVKIDNTNVTVSLFPFYTASGNKQYYTTVDDDAIKYATADQNINGIDRLVWNFSTSAASDTSSGGASTIVRLTPDGTKQYVNLSPNDQSTFAKNLGDEIATALECDSSRIKIPTHYQYSNFNNSGDQIFMRVNIAQGSQSQDRGASYLANDLNDMITYKSSSPISTGTNSKNLDQYNGAWLLPVLWNRYKYILIGVFVGLALLGLLWWLACRRRYSRFGKAKRRQYAMLNFLTIFVSTLIIVDLVLDILFIVFHGKDEKWILPVSRELNEDKYRKWWQMHSRTALATTLLAGLDVEALNVASSRTASIGSLNAPYSPEADRRIFYATTILLLIEDVPQFIFLIIYQKVTIIPAIIPILVLSSCSILIVLRVISIIYLAFFCEREWRYEDEILDDEPKREAYADASSEKPPKKTDKKPDNRPLGQTHIVTLSDPDPLIDIRDSHEKPPGKHPAFVEPGIMSDVKNGKKGKDTSKAQESKTLRPPGTGVGARISDISSDVERPIGKYTESQMMDLPSDGHFETRRTQYVVDGITHIREEQVYVPETTREEFDSQHDVHRSHRQGDGGEIIVDERTYTLGDAPNITSDTHRPQMQISQGDAPEIIRSPMSTREQTTTYHSPSSQTTTTTTTIRGGTPTTTTTTWLGDQEFRELQGGNQGGNHGGNHGGSRTYTTEETHQLPGGVTETVYTTTTENSGQEFRELQGGNHGGNHGGSRTYTTQETHQLPGGGTETIYRTTTETTEEETE